MMKTNGIDHAHHKTLEALAWGNKWFVTRSVVDAVSAIRTALHASEREVARLNAANIHLQREVERRDNLVQANEALLNRMETVKEEAKRIGGLEKAVSRLENENAGLENANGALRSSLTNALDDMGRLSQKYDDVCRRMERAIQALGEDE